MEDSFQKGAVLIHFLGGEISKCDILFDLPLAREDAKSLLGGGKAEGKI